MRRAPATRRWRLRAEASLRSPRSPRARVPSDRRVHRQSGPGCDLHGDRAGRTMTSWRTTIRLRGPGGEPVDLWRTIVSNGINELPPAQIDEAARVMVVTVPPAGGARTLRLREARGAAVVESTTTVDDAAEARALVRYL